MSSVKWTKNQQNAIHAQGGSVLVSAAAGSGKTAVLVQRVIEILTNKDNPVSIDRMLIVTFTRAASAEMRTRIEQALNNLLRDDPYNNYLLHQKQLLYNAKISTIDGFCTDFVRQYFYKLDIQNDFRIADEKELELLRQKALDNTLEYFYNEKSEDFLDLVDSFCSYRDDKSLREDILKIYDFLVSIPFMDKWLDSVLTNYDNTACPVKTSPYVTYLLKYASESISFARALLENAFDSFELHTDLPTEKVQRIFTTIQIDEKIINDLETCCSDGDWDELYKQLSTLKFSNFPTIKGAGNDPLKVAVKGFRDNYIFEIKNLAPLIFHTYSQIEDENVKLYPKINALIKCVKRFHKMFSNAKREKNLVDFPDIENYMIQLICKQGEGDTVEYTDTAREISEMFDCIMVDEFQDINEVQNLIFKAISKDESNLFMVGDVKQSIYSFRQANPDIFVDYKNRYELYSNSKDAYPAKIILDKNFRSSDEILQACNFVFKNIMSQEVGGIVYSDEERLFYGADYPDTDEPAVEFDIVDTTELDTQENETSLILEARHVAKKIFDMIYVDNTTVYDNSEQRKATFGDIAILLRTAKGQAQKSMTFVNELAKLGIPVTTSEKKSFFDINEIKVMVNLLRTIDNPMQDIPVLSVMLSPIFAFTADDLARIRCKDKKQPLYLSVLQDSKANEKSRNFISTIAKYRRLAVTVSVDKLVNIILQSTDFSCIVMALNGERDNNLKRFSQYARTYSANGYKSLTSFVTFLDRIQENGLDLNSGEKAEGISASNCVKVMSIHSSKGLEFPICFICNTDKGFNTEDASDALVLDSNGGLGIRYKNDYLKYDTIQRKVAALMLKNSLISEEIRVLYVAMTRAKQRLIITCTQKNPERYISGIDSQIIDNKITPYVVKNMKSFSDWITACSLLHPSCDQWRNLVSSRIKVDDDADLKPWKFQILTKADLDSDNTDIKKNPNETVVPVEADMEFLNSFLERINYSYPNSRLSMIPQKVSASELAHRENSAFTKIMKTPSFIQPTTAAGVEIGTAFHSFMENCDLKKAVLDVKSEAYRLADCGFLSESQLELLDFDKITDFMKSSIISRVLKSDEYFREYKFTVKINCSDYDKNIDDSLKEQKIIMQGAVDLSFAEGDKLVIVDYKTDRVKDINRLGELYSKQIYLYKNAMQQCTGLTVDEMYIYSLNLNDFLPIKN